MSIGTTSSLFGSVAISGLNLRNRIVMSPMSRYRSPGGVPDAAVVEYYRRRAAAGVGLIVSEATYIDHPGAPAYPNVPHFYGVPALAGWRRVLEAVHAEGAHMVPQIWHVGNTRKLGAPPDPAVPGYGPSTVDQDGRTLGNIGKRTIPDGITISAIDSRAVGEIRQLCRTMDKQVVPR